MPAPKISINTQAFSTTELQDREWLLANGLGGYSSGTLLGDIARRYHGLFIPNLANPKGRHLLISRFSDELIIGERRWRLDALPAEGSNTQKHYLSSFELQGNIARWTYDVDGVTVEKSVLMSHQQNTVCVRYVLLKGAPLTLKMRPYFVFRRHDTELNSSVLGPLSIAILGNQYEVSLPGSSLLLRFRLTPEPSVFIAQADMVEQRLSRECSRGYPCIESTYSAGYFEKPLTQAEPVVFIASTHDWEKMDFDTEAAFAAEHRRTEALLSLARLNAKPQDDFPALLTTAADQFLVLPANRIGESVLASAEGHELRTVIAGYHWFGDWGRDTMISLEGLMLCTGRYREARATLQTFANYVSDGLIPNLFPEGERLGLYHTVDATLWYFHAIHRYVKVTGDSTIVPQLMPVLKSIIEHYIHGTKFGIHMDPEDGLIAAGAEGYQLTWMDAKVDGWVVTPRRGKPVEIQALWFNALQVMGAWNVDNEQEALSYMQLATRVKQSFNKRYWNAQLNCLFDVIDGEAGNDASIRPNQIFAISLDFPVLHETHWQAVIDTVQRELLTPFGLRTLSPGHPDYKPTYRGDLRARDAAYHQGTVWPWLMGHFIDAWLKVYNDKYQARQMLSAFPKHCEEAGIGSISEVFDAEEPHMPHGCIAQAWSVAEVLRAWLRTEEI